jgi:NADPH-dependent curcumin reductase CurA
MARRIKMEGFMALDYFSGAEEAMTDLAEWVMAGKITWREDVQVGFAAMTETLPRLFDGRNQGKPLLKPPDPEELSTE